MGQPTRQSGEDAPTGNVGGAMVSKVSKPKMANRYSWATDKSRFGLKLMEKMGWTEGKGLGQGEDGRVNHIGVRRHESGVGVGADTTSEHAWRGPGIVAQGLSDVLAKLSNVGTAGTLAGELKEEAMVKMEDMEVNVKTEGVEVKVKTEDKEVEMEGGVKEGGEGEKMKQGTVKPREVRGYYGRRRARVNVSAYSREQMREIFGGVDSSGGGNVLRAQPVSSPVMKVPDERRGHVEVQEGDRTNTGDVGGSMCDSGGGVAAGNHASSGSDGATDEVAGQDDGVEGKGLEEVETKMKKKNKKKKRDQKKGKDKSSVVIEKGVGGGIGKKPKKRKKKKENQA